MTYQSPLLAAPPARPPAAIAVLRCRDEFHMDPAPLKTLFTALPDHEAENIVCRALEDIAQRLDALQAARTKGSLADIALPAKRISAVADQIGLTEVSLVASHAAKAAQSSCTVALGATMARLERAFDAAVSQIWDFRYYD